MMKKTFIKIISVVMVVSMCCSLMGISALAESVTDPVTGNVTTTEQVAATEPVTVGGTTTEETVFEFTVTDPLGEELSKGGYTEVKETTEESIEGEFKQDETPAFEVEVPETVVSGTPELEVELGNGGTAADSETPDILLPEGGTVDYDAESGKTTVTNTAEKTEVSVGAEQTTGPVTDENGVTTTVTTQDTTTVKAVTTETVVVTDRSLEAVLQQGKSESESVVTEEQDADIAEFNAMLKDMGIIEEALSEEDAKLAIEALKNGDSQNAIAAALMEKGQLDQEAEAGDEAEAPKIVVSDVTFKVGDKVSDSDENSDNDLYHTEISFQVVIENEVDGSTTVTVIDENGKQIESKELSALEKTEDGKYLLPGLQLSENLNYNLQFDFAAQQKLGADAYVYNATIETTTVIETETQVRVNVGDANSKFDSDLIPGGDYEVSSGGQNNAKVFLDDGPADGNYTVIDSNGKAFRATMKGNKLCVEMFDRENGDNFLVVEDGKYEGTITLIDENGDVSTLYIKLKSSSNSNGHNNYNGSGYSESYTSVKSSQTKTDVDNYEYGFGYDKEQSLSASESLNLSFTVDESTVERESASSSQTKVDTDKTTVKEWVEDIWEETVEQPEEEPEDEDEDEKDRIPVKSPGPKKPAPQQRSYEPDYYQPMTVAEGKEIPDEAVPLAQAPQTGSVTAIFALVSIVSGLLLAVLIISSKKKCEE